MATLNVCADGGFLCEQCVKDEHERISEVDPNCPDDDQWRIVGQQTAEDSDRCDHCYQHPNKEPTGPLESCLICNGPLILLGRLGSREHYRCRNCGMEQSYKATEIKPDEMEEDHGTDNGG